MDTTKFFCDENEQYFSIEELERLLTPKAFKNYCDYDYNILFVYDDDEPCYRVRYNNGMVVATLADAAELNDFFETIGIVY